MHLNYNDTRELKTYSRNLMIKIILTAFVYKEPFVSPGILMAGYFNLAVIWIVYLLLINLAQL